VLFVYPTSVLQTNQSILSATAFASPLQRLVFNHGNKRFFFSNLSRQIF